MYHHNWIDKNNNVYSGKNIHLTNMDDVDTRVIHGKGELVTTNFRYVGYFIYGIKHGTFEVTDIKTGDKAYVVYDNGFLRNQIEK